MVFPWLSPEKKCSSFRAATLLKLKCLSSISKEGK
nr:MAG TPA: hypothetical protein [Caudoviricetes sp.]